MTAIGTRAISLGASAILLAAGIAKCLDSSSIEVVLHEVYGVAGGERVLSVLLGAVEIFLALLLLIRATVGFGLKLAAVLAGVFLASVTYQLVTRPDLACGCTVWSDAEVAITDVLFNAIFFLLLLLAAALRRDRQGIRPETSS